LSLDGLEKLIQKSHSDFFRMRLFFMPINSAENIYFFVIVFARFGIMKIAEKQHKKGFLKGSLGKGCTF